MKYTVQGSMDGHVHIEVYDTDGESLALMSLTAHDAYVLSCAIGDIASRVGELELSLFAIEGDTSEEDNE